MQARPTHARARRAAAALAALLLAQGFAGCLSAAREGAASDAATGAADAPPLVGLAAEDAAGDAREKQTAYVLNHLRYCRLGGGATADACAAARQAAAGFPGAGGVPSAPVHDLLGFTLAETPTHLVATLEVASLPEGWQGVDDPEHTTWTNYFVCWRQGEERELGCAVLVVRDSDGTVAVEASYDRYTRACNDWWWCTSGIPYEVEHGAPARIRLMVPRDALPEGEAAARLEEPMAAVQRVDGSRAYLEWRVAAPTDPGGGSHVRGGDLVDEAYADDAFVFRTARVDAPPRPPRAQDAAGDARDSAGPRPDLDILALDLVETPTTLTLSATIADLREESVRYELYAAIAFAGTHAFNAGVGKDDNGQQYTYGGACVDDECREWRSFLVEGTIVPGSPVWLNISYARADIGSPSRGETFTLSYAETWGGAGTYAAQGVGPAWVRGWVGFGVDHVAPLPHHRLAFDTAESPFAAEGGASSTASLGDARPPRPLVGASEAQFDVVGFGAQPRQPAESVLEIAIADLSSIEVPAGYRGVLYALALETSEGAVMAGYYKGEGELGSIGYFCAPDSAVLVDERADPARSAPRRIDGMLPPRADARPQSSIMLIFPHACFGPDAPDRLDVLRMGAGTFLVGGAAPGEELVPVDLVTRDEPFVLHAAAVGAPRAWHDALFGSFWDILGVALALVLAGGGVAVVRRRRRILQRYLDELQRHVASHGRRPRALEAALVDLRQRLQDDLARGRLREEHHGIAAARVERALAKARVASLLDDVGDLPHRLLTNLQEMLSDGELSPTDYRILCALLDEAPLQEDARRAIRGRLGEWLVQPVDEAPAHRLVRP